MSDEPHLTWTKTNVIDDNNCIAIDLEKKGRAQFHSHKCLQDVESSRQQQSPSNQFSLKEYATKD